MNLSLSDDQFKQLVINKLIALESRQIAFFHVMLNRSGVSQEEFDRTSKWAIEQASENCRILYENLFMEFGDIGL